VSVIDPKAWMVPWSLTVIRFDQHTGDRRRFRHGSLSLRTLPMPLLLQTKTAQAHMGAVVVGSVTRSAIDDVGVHLRGTWLNPEAVPEVNRALALMEVEQANASADLEPDMELSVEEDPNGGRPYIDYLRAKICGVTIVPIAAFDLPSLTPDPNPEASLALTGTTSWRSMPAQPREVEYNADQAFKNILAWADGSEERARSMFLWYDPAAAAGTRDRFRLPIGDVVNGKAALNFHAIYAAAALVSGAHGGLPTVSDEEKGRLRRIISEIYLRLGNLYGDPSLQAPWDKRSGLPDVKSSSLEAIAASAAPIAPPAEWFEDPKLPGPTPSPIIGCDGRFMVHLATHSSCHRALQATTGQCFTPPPSPSGYRRFTDGTVLASDGRIIPVGRIMMDGTHPPLSFSPAMTKEHYDKTSTCAAIAAAGEDDHGIWLAGALVPGTSPEQVAMLRRSPMSGDWRRHGDEGLDLVAVLAVNIAGFPAPYSGAVRSLSVDAGECQSLVASGAPVGDDIPVTTPVETPAAAPEPVTPPEPATASEPVVPAAPAPLVDIDAIAKTVADRADRDLRARHAREERLAVLFALDSADRAKRIEDLTPLSQLGE